MFLFPANNICGMNKVTWDFAFSFGEVVSMTLLMSRSVALGWVEGFRITYSSLEIQQWAEVFAGRLS